MLTNNNTTQLEKEGYTVVKGYLDVDVAKEYNTQLWDVYRQLVKPVKLHSGMIQYLGHTKPQWELRHLCKGIFEQLWKTSDLVTSFDGFCIMDGDSRVQRVAPDAFLHRDQKLTSAELLTYQGLISLSDNTDVESGGFVCVPKSHLITEVDYKVVN